MATGDELALFDTNLDRSRDNVLHLDAQVETLEDTAQTARRALEYGRDLESDLDATLDSIHAQQFALKILEKTGPLKLPSRALKVALDAAEPVFETLLDKIRAINAKVEQYGLIDKLQALEDKLAALDDRLDATSTQLAGHSQTTGTMIFAFDLVGPPLDPVEAAVDTTVMPLNVVLDALNTTYEDIRDALSGIGLGLQPSWFSPLASVTATIDAIASAITTLSRPIEIAYSRLKPLEPLLDAVGFVYSVTVDPVVDWLLDTLGIDKLLEKIADKVGELLPSATVLDTLVARIDQATQQIDALLDPQGLQAQFEDFIDRFGVELLAELGIDAAGALRVGTAGGELLAGRDGATDVLDPRAGNDTVEAYGGGDLIVASAGNDIIRGGAGTDRLVFDDNFTNYEFSYDSASGATTFLDRADGSQGSELAFDVELYIFADIRVTHSQLVHNTYFATGPVLDGTAEDDLLVAATAAVAINGKLGDDKLYGGPATDTLNGGAGNDFFVSGAGADVVAGGAGIDTWFYPDNPLSNSRTTVDLVIGEAWDGTALDTLSGIENATTQDAREVEFFGNAGRNVLSANDARDYLLGRGGNDVLIGGDGRDLLIGGPGADTVHGGADIDTLLAGGPVANGRGDSYDGGAGAFDRLVYSRLYTDYGIRPESGRPIETQEVSGPVRIFAATGTIERLSANGASVEATDQATGIEVYVGSDGDDTLYGAEAIDGVGITIDGGGGDDLLFSRGAQTANGGQGNDRFIVTGTGTSIDGGGGIDTLDLRGFADARWSYRNDFNQNARIEAYAPQETDDLGSSQATPTGGAARLFAGYLSSVEVILLGSANDEAYLQGTQTVTIRGGEGDDRLVRWTSNDGSPSAVLYGEGGDDFLGLRLEGELYGGNGDDELAVDASGDGHVVQGNAGDDRFRITRMDGSIDGGDGFDVLSLAARSDVHRIEVDLLAGVLTATATSNGFDIDLVTAAISRLEMVVGDDRVGDRVTGSAANERLAGRGGNDTMAGGGGLDEMYGGAGNDSLDGGAGNDLLHGGGGSDTMIGGAGRDIASYANAAPVGAFGELVAGEFGAIVADLALGSVSHALGTDVLIGIEGITGGKAGDDIRGSDGADVLSGDDGNDTLRGGAGNDVLLMGRGDDLVEGGAGRDVIVMDSGNNTVSGGSGLDRLDFGSAPGALDIDLAAGTWSGAFDDPSAVWADTGGSEARLINGVSMTPQDVLEARAAFADDAADLARDTVTEDGSSAIDFLTVRTEYSGLVAGIEELNGGAGSDTIAGSARDEVFGGGAGNDRLLGNVGNDSLAGAEGNDTLAGGRGNDTLRGGAGADAFRFDTALAASGNVDTVLDFESGVDRLQLDNDVFAALGAAAGALLAPSRFQSGAGLDSGQDANDRIVYDTATGALYYDPDGNGAQVAIRFAVLGVGTHPELGAADFRIVD